MTDKVTDEKIDAEVVAFATRAMEAAERQPAIAVVMLIDAACCIMLSHMPGSAATKLAPTYGEYMAEQIATALGKGETVQ